MQEANLRACLLTITRQIRQNNTLRGNHLMADHGFEIPAVCGNAIKPQNNSWFTQTCAKFRLNTE